jgi:hypothetical protein
MLEIGLVWFGWVWLVFFLCNIDECIEAKMLCLLACFACLLAGLLACWLLSHTHVATAESINIDLL